jgi:hypothetical protein
LDLLAFVLAGFIKWQTLETKIEPKEDNGHQLSTYILHNDHTRDSITFVPGDSLWEIEERNRLDAERQSRELYANASYTRGESYQKTTGKVEVVSKDPGFYNCVAYSKAMSGINRVLGAGGRYAINSQEPQVGKIGSTKGTPHAVYIEKVEGDKITITESNYYRGLITRRVLTRSDFIGFII